MKVDKHNALSSNTASGRTGSSIVWCESAVRNHRAINATNTVISPKFSYQYERNSVSSPNGVRSIYSTMIKHRAFTNIIFL
jgi:hypothetical protein